MGFSCTAQQADGKVILTVTGDVDLAAHQQFEADAEPWAQGAGDLAVECSGITFLDSMGLRVLVNLRRQVLDSGREFTLVAASRPVLRVLELAGVTDLFMPADEAECPAGPAA